MNASDYRDLVAFPGPSPSDTHHHVESSPPQLGRRRRVGGCVRRRDETGQALIEFVLVIPLMILLIGVAFNGWSAIQLDIGLTSAARAGAIKAANDLATNPTDIPDAWNDATTAINENQGVTGVYQNMDSNSDDYVNMSEATDTIASGVTINVVTITISQVSDTLIPVVGNFHVTAHATARYS